MFQPIMESIVKDEKLKEVFVYLDDVTVCGSTDAEHDENRMGFL